MGYADENDRDLQQPILAKAVASEATPVATFVEPYAGLAIPNKWSSGLFDCFAHPGGGSLGFVSLCLPFVQYGTLAEQLPQDATCHGGSWAHAAASYLALDCLAAAAHCTLLPGISLLPASALLHRRLRGQLRDKYGIEGTPCRDLCTTWWCGPCALAQETRELLIRQAAERQAARQAGGTAAGHHPYLVGHMMLPPPDHCPGQQYPHMAAAAPHAYGAPPLQATGVPVPVTAMPAAPGTVVMGEPEGAPAEQQHEKQQPAVADAKALQG